mmetsp:Transcript_45629/g.67291  ORF Transcript_45629/g.67291 Transcript_45629/m.67291 type:complete len:528 (-) Transcript_45629:15-1598(-)|eukprot:CAMPEP_0195530486 /NCGR_PEP_ID=MMETSP0794_2-20130614/33386_1 /TAXON_ID=515487 /ORGANISM="Stephanopyxis turris, Strain CCMP 815" /LENGTH=527 /DNA_ID=CAMNT_0040662009 /DNA_START=135 /DNA_END=1718 /DNA_ORIENTATION=+
MRETSNLVLNTINENGTEEKGAAMISDVDNDLYDYEGDNDESIQGEQYFYRWSPSGKWYKDFFHFVGPGWFVSIAYVDPGNYQADIQAGATTRYSLLFALFWTSVLSIYVQILCVRLAYYGQVTLSEAQARDTPNRSLRYLNWFIAEFSTVITDLPEVIGIAIALKMFLGSPYWVGVVLSLFTTMLFLGVMKHGIRVLETLIVVFVGVMSVAVWVEMSFVGVDAGELVRGWAIGFVDVRKEDIFSITGILGSVVMPHNLYLHTAACMSRRVKRQEDVVKQAVKWCSIEPVFPILVSFFVNMAIVAISAESVYGSPNAEDVGLTDFCNYFVSLKAGCIFWGVALLAAGQSSAITTTFTGQYVMDGFLNIQLPVATRAIITRLVAITPCVVISVMFPDQLNKLVNIVNSSLAFLLPFAFTPLVKYNCSQVYMGKYAAQKAEKYTLYCFAILVWAINAVALSMPGGGFFGDLMLNSESASTNFTLVSFQIIIQLFYFGWNIYTLFTPVLEPMTPLEEERPYDEQFAPEMS